MTNPTLLALMEELEGRLRKTDFKLPLHIGHMSENDNTVDIDDKDGLSVAEDMYEEDAGFLITAANSVPRLIRELREAMEVIEDLAYPNKMSETTGTLLARFEGLRERARAFLARCKGEE